MKHIAICFYGLTRANVHCWNSIQKKILDARINKNIHFSIFIHTWQKPAGEASVQAIESSSKELVRKFLNFQLKNNFSKIQKIEIHKQETHHPQIVDTSWGQVNRSNAINAHLSIGSVLDQVCNTTPQIEGVLCIRTDAFFMKELDMTSCSASFMHSGKRNNEKFEVEDLFFYIPYSALTPFLKMRDEVQDHGYWERNIYNFLLHTAAKAQLKIESFNITYCDGVSIWRPGWRWRLSWLKQMFFLR